MSCQHNYQNIKPEVKKSKYGNYYDKKAEYGTSKNGIS